MKRYLKDISKRVISLALALALMCSIVLADTVNWVHIAEPLSETLHTEEENVLLTNQQGSVYITGSNIGTLRIERDASEDTLIVYIDADSSIKNIEVTGSVYISIAPGSAVSGVRAESGSDVFIDGAVEHIDVSDNTFVRLQGSADQMSVQGNAFINIMSNTVVGEAVFTSDSNGEAVLNVLERGHVKTVSTDCGLIIEGVGYVDQVQATASSVVVIDGTITKEDGVRTVVETSGKAQSSYIDDELFVMHFSPIENISLAEGTLDLPFTVVDVVGYTVFPNVTVTSSDSSIISATMADGMIHLERIGAGNAIITLTAKLESYRDVKYAFCVYAADDAAKVVEEVASKTPTEKNTAVVALSAGNACNKNIYPDDVVTIAGVAAEEGAVLSVVSSNVSVAKVSAIHNGSFTITALSEGMTAITITATKESTEEITYLPGVQKFLVRVDKTEETPRVQLTIAPPSQAELTKEYDGNTALALTAGEFNLNENAEVTNTGKLSNLRPGDEVYIAIKAFYGTPAAGEGKTVYIAYHLYGKDADKYIAPVDRVVNNGVITKRTLTVSAEAESREYIHGDAIVQLPTISMDGLVKGDSVNLHVKNAYGEMADPFVGTDKSVTLQGIRIFGTDADNYKLALSKKTVVSIHKQQVQAPAVTQSLVYTGFAQDLNIETNPLYTIEGDVATNVGSYTAVISLVDAENYRWANSDSEPLLHPWIMEAKDAGNTDITISPIADKTYTGSPIEPKPLVMDASRGVALVEGVDFVFTYTNNVNKGTASITATGIGNYAGKTADTFKIVTKEMSGLNISIAAIDDLTYTGSPITPKPVITDTDRNVALVEGVDFEYAYENNVETGTATITIIGKGNYAGSVSDSFTIVKKIIADGNLSIEAIDDQAYTGSAIEPKPVITDTDRNVALVEGVDFEYVYENNVETGIATITVIGKGNYESNVSGSFEIVAKAITEDNITIETIEDQIYTGSAIEPKPIITDTDRNVALVEGIDFEYTYENNVETGTATITITGIGNYEGTLDATFEIVTKEMSSANISIASTANQTYTGSAIEPKPVVRDTQRDVTLVEGTDYEYDYENNVDTGTATIIVRGLGNYSGSVNATFSIVAKALSDSYINIASVANVVYSGTAHQPRPIVTDTALSASLVAGTDFDYSYTSNINAGTATIKVTGKGNYSGTLQTTFTIEKADPALRFTNASSGNSGKTLSLATSSNSTGTVTYARTSGTTNTSLSGSTLSLGYPGEAVVTASITATSNYKAATATQTITINGVAPTITSVTGTPGTTSASFDSSNRTSVAMSTQYSNPSGSPVTVRYFISRSGSAGSFVYTNGSTATTARMAIGTYTVTAYASNEYGYHSKSTTVTVSPAADTPGYSGTASGYGCTMTFSNPNPNYTITYMDFSFATASGHSGSDTWYVKVNFADGTTKTHDSGTAKTGVSKSYSGLTLTNVSSIVFHYEVDNSHSASCLGTQTSFSIRQTIPQNNNQDGSLDNADDAMKDLEDELTPAPMIIPMMMVFNYEDGALTTEEVSSEMDETAEEEVLIEEEPVNADESHDEVLDSETFEEEASETADISEEESTDHVSDEAATEETSEIDISEEETKEEPEENASEEPEDISGDVTLDDSTEEPVDESIEEEVNEETKDSTQDIADESSEEASEGSEEEVAEGAVSEEDATENTDKSAEESLEDGSIDSMDESTEEVLEEGSIENTEEHSEESLEDGSIDSMDESTEEVLEEGSIENTEEHSEESLEEGSDELTDGQDDLHTENTSTEDAAEDNSTSDTANEPVAETEPQE